MPPHAPQQQQQMSQQQRLAQASLPHTITSHDMPIVTTGGLWNSLFPVDDDEDNEEDEGVS